jgi:hypothetical protein
MNPIYRITALCIFLIAAVAGIAQTGNEDKSLTYFNKTEAGISFGLGSFQTDMYNGIQKKVRNDEIVVTFQTINGFKYMNKIAIGVSFGAEVWQNGLFWPIYGYLGYDFKPADNTFFADVYIGSAPGNRDANSFYHAGKGAFAFSIGLGYKMKVAKKLKFMYEVFYKYQSIESTYDYKTEFERNDSIFSYSRTVDYKIPLHFAGFKIGICFP